MRLLVAALVAVPVVAFAQPKKKHRAHRHDAPAPADTTPAEPAPEAKPDAKTDVAKPDDPAPEPKPDAAKPDDTTPTDTPPAGDAKPVEAKPTDKPGGGDVEKKADDAKDTKDKDKDKDDKDKATTLGGYIQPSFNFIYRGDAAPKDRLRYGAQSTRAGLTLDGKPLTHWGYHLEIVVAGETNDFVTSVMTVDNNGDGVPDDVQANTEHLPTLFVEHATVEYAPTESFKLVAGQMRVPFTVQEQSPSTELMFPSRSGPNDIFVPGPDLGLDLVFKSSGELVVAQLGAFNGTGEPIDSTAIHGLVYSARIDVNPLGEFPFSEANAERGPTRIGFGAGALFYTQTQYDMAGYPGSDLRDLRASASVRLRTSGLYVQSEVLRRQRTDSLSARPEITTGAYAQASWFEDVGIGISPIARLGWAAQDQGFDTRTTLFFEAGMAFYPYVKNAEGLRLILQYLGERRVTEAEQANGVVAQAQMVF